MAGGGSLTQPGPPELGDSQSGEQGHEDSPSQIFLKAPGTGGGGTQTKMHQKVLPASPLSQLSSQALPFDLQAKALSPFHPTQPLQPLVLPLPDPDHRFIFE